MTTHEALSPRSALAERLALLAADVLGAGLLVCLMLLPSAIALSRGVSFLRNTVLQVPPLPQQLEGPAQNSVILASDGTQLAVVHGVENRMNVSLDEVPPLVRSAVIATEDEDFWTHHGVNHAAILRALLANLRSGGIEQGGSTITQQYVKNVLLSNEQTVSRKIKEALYAVELERRLSKEEILERYLNTAYFGDGVYGIGTAAQHYFSKPVAQLDLPEAALLAGLIRAPEGNNPTRDPEAAKTRRDVVLVQMALQGFISRDEARDAQATEVRLHVSEDASPVEPFFVDWVKRILADPEVDLQRDAQAALGADEEQRWRQELTGGLVIHTTLDPRMQSLADGTIHRYLDDPAGDPLAAIVTVQPGSGAVAALAVGPKSYGECSTTQTSPCLLTKVNPAVAGAGGSGRQAGSSFKPIVISAALREGLPTSWSTETSSRQPIPGCIGEDNKPYAPENYEGGGGGVLDMYEAIRQSSNVFHVKLTAAVGVLKVRDMARTLGIVHSPNLDSFGPTSCSIGLGTANVYPLEMASVFATLANRGVRCLPFAVSRVEDREGNLLYQHGPECDRVLEQGIADRVTDILQGPPSPGGTAGYIAGQLNRPVAGKTGTTEQWVDAWFNGYVPQFATAAWLGYEIPHPMVGVEAGGETYDRVTGGSIPGRMWADYMTAALQGVEVQPFPKPPPPPTVTVPDVTGRSEAEARAVLEAQRLRPRSSVVTHYLPAGTVIDQSPYGGSQAPAGSEVTLSVSDGKGRRPSPPVPDVKGQSQAEAVRRLTQAGYEVAISERTVTDRSRAGLVVEQSPVGGTPLDPPSRVQIWVGRYGASATASPQDDEETPSPGSSDSPTPTSSRRRN